MAKRTTTPPPAPAPAPDMVNEALVELAETMLGDFFFNPDNEDLYKQTLSQNRPTGSAGIVLDQETVELEDGTCTVQLEALRAYTKFRVGMMHPAFTATVEGTWSFDKEELRQTKFTRSGDPEAIEQAVDTLIEAIDDRDLEGEDEEFADFLSEIEDDEEVPMIGDDPTEPPGATPLDRSRAKAIAKRVARHRDSDISPEDRGWLEQTPQILPVITDALVEAAAAPEPDEAIVLAWHLMLSLALEFVRYRQDRGWEWADTMLAAFQQRLIDIAKADAVPREDWFMMCSALSEARVPVSDEVQTALADAGFRPDDVDEPPEEMLKMVRHLMDELARMVSSPFEVIEALKGSGAVLPAMLRSFMTTELALSEHSLLREAVPLLLLDDDSSVRVAAARALEQIAHPETLSPDMLRRAITVRNWIPAADRGPLDAAIRKARLAGVVIGAWPEPTRDLELYASIIDGSGAQSILAASRAGKKGLFAGVLLRHGTGVMDTWVDYEISRGQIGKLLREAQMAAPNVRVDMGFVDRVVQHAIGASVEHDGVPPSSLLEVAELLGGVEWKDRRIDINAEADRMFAALDPADRTPAGITAGYQRLGDWMAKEEVFGSWFEDGPQVQKALAKLPRNDKAGMLAVVMRDILPPQRAKWAEWFLILALWYQAAVDAKQRTRARDAVIVAHALAGDGALDQIPTMAVIALQTIRAVLLGGW